MQKYLLTHIENNWVIEEAYNLKRAYYLAWVFSNQWESPVAITICYGEHMEDIDIVEPDGLY